MNIILFLAGVFLLTFLLGWLLEKIRIPWIFSALLIGLGLAAYNPFKEVTNSEAFIFLARLGMYFLLFMIGFQINIKEITRRKKFILRTTIAIIFAEAFFGSFLVHYVFDISWLISILVALSFATVGEAVLLPILDEFKLTKTRLGQTIIGVGVLDDLIEVATIIILTVILGANIGYGHTRISLTLAILAGLFIFAYSLTKFKKQLSKIQFNGTSSFFIFIVFFIFFFVGVGLVAEAAALGALLAGMAIKNLIPSNKIRVIDSHVKTMTYGFLAPIFFLWVGIDTDINYLLKFPLLIIAVLALTNATKIITSYLMGRKELGPKNSIILGISLTVKFSTSIVIIKLLFENNLIPLSLYSVLVGTTILFKFVVPLLLSHLIKKWDLKPGKM